MIMDTDQESTTDSEDSEYFDDVEEMEFQLDPVSSKSMELESIGVTYSQLCSSGPVTSEDAFKENLRMAFSASQVGIYPQLVPTGSSGSYFVYDREGRKLGIFKPRDEEPFATLNPRWAKFFQRLVCFCCFGRSFLIPNHGYLSEVGACIVDRYLGFNLVPTTKIVKMSSPTFNYDCSPLDGVLPKPKKGSYQVFMNGYHEAATVLNEWMERGIHTVLTSEQEAQFTVEFQKMCILDYLIRNTDRHLENWLIGRDGEEGPLRIAAIDNGLAFPTQHPETTSIFRRFPFNWATLPWANQPWNDDLRRDFLSMMTPNFLHSLCENLLRLFKHDRSHPRVLNYDQIRVLRGQAWNLRQSIYKQETPSQLVKRSPVLLKKRYRRQPPSDSWPEVFRVKRSERSDGPCVFPFI